MTISLGVLLMVKNEQDSITTTIQSVCPYVDQVLVYDTGSQDNTIQIIKDVCKKNDKLLSLKQGVFTTFPQSRNEALEFAEKMEYYTKKYHSDEGFWDKIKSTLKVQDFR